MTRSLWRSAAAGLAVAVGLSFPTNLGAQERPSRTDRIVEKVSEAWKAAPRVIGEEFHKLHKPEDPAKSISGHINQQEAVRSGELGARAGCALWRTVRPSFKICAEYYELEDDRRKEAAGTPQAKLMLRDFALEGDKARRAKEETRKHGVARWRAYDHSCSPSELSSDPGDRSVLAKACAEWRREIEEFEVAGGFTPGQTLTVPPLIPSADIEGGIAEVDKLAREAAAIASSQVREVVASTTGLSQSAAAARAQSSAAVSEVDRRATNNAMSSLRETAATYSSFKSQSSSAAAGGNMCALSSQQIASYEQGIARSQPYAAVSAEHAGAIRVYNEGISEQRKWHSSNCR